MLSILDPRHPSSKEGLKRKLEWAEEQRIKDGRLAGGRYYDKKIHSRNHGHAYKIGAMVAIIKEMPGGGRCEKCKDDTTFYIAEDINGHRFGIGKCEIE